jgi:hypothetical protein
MPIITFRANGVDEIDVIELKVNEWMEKLDAMTEVKQIHTAMSESEEAGPNFVVTIWYKGPLDSN